MSGSKERILFVFLMVQAISSYGQTYIGNFKSISASGRKISIQSDSSGFRFTFYKSNLVRVDFLSKLSATFDSSVIVVQDTTTPVSYTIADGDSSLTIETSSLLIVCKKFPIRVGFYSTNGQFIIGEPISGGVAFSQLQRIVNFSIQPNEHLYGTGERGIGLDLRGQAFDSYNEQDGGYGSPAPSTMNVNIPFVISTDNYGIYFENTYKGHFDIGNSNPNVLTYTVYGGELSYYFIYDSTMKNVLSDYTWLTGRAPLLPKWAYGYIQSKYGYRSESDASQMIQRMRNDSVPCDAIILDLYWYQYMGDLSWNTSLWPNPGQMTSNFLSQGFKTIVITEPYIVQPSSNFSEASSSGYLATDSSSRTYTLSNWWSCGCNAGLLDITNPAAQSWWWSKYYSILSSGVSGLWTDLGEPERDYSDMLFYGGSDSKVHNIYDFLWAKTLFDGFNTSFPNARLFNLTRSGYAGIQRFGVVTWSGDVSKTFGGLAVQLPFLLNMGMSGIAYHNSDIGGFDNGSTTPELYTRWMEFGAFCPVMRAHGYDGDNGTEPWTFGTATEDIVRKMIELRYSLILYNYTMAHEAFESGIPLARPLILEYPNDPNVYEESSAYMWGDNILVAPVVQSGQTTETFYLPQGRWLDYWTDKIYNGGTTVNVDAPLYEVPLFIKAGSIIPMAQVMNYVDEFPADTLQLAIYPDPNANAQFTLYEDDGKTLAYQNGAFAASHLSQSMVVSGGSQSMQISIGAPIGNYNGKPYHRVYVCEIHKLTANPAAVLFSNLTSGQSRALQSLSSIDKLNDAACGFFCDALSEIVYVKVQTDADSAYSILMDSVSLTNVKKTSGTPSGYRLEQNFPNPFNPTTAINYALAAEGFVTLEVYDVLGRGVQRLVNERQDAGSHSVIFDARALPSGVYFYRMIAGNFVSTKKLVLTK
jgi:alpha-glucosidase (family GH31 glycosyl hydrolase)